MLGPYHTLCPLEESNSEERPSQVFGMRTAMFKGISVADGAGYALRRIDGRQVSLSLHGRSTSIPFPLCSFSIARLYLNCTSNHLPVLRHIRDQCLNKLTGTGMHNGPSPAGGAGNALFRTDVWQVQILIDSQHTDVMKQ